MRKKSVVALLLALSLTVSMAGCGADGSGNTNNEYDSKGIVLEEPVSAKLNTDTVVKRDLYNFKIYQGAVLPYIEEYAAEDGITFNRYGTYPGRKVSVGSELIISDTTAADERIKSQEESIQKFKESHQKELDRLNKSLEEAEKNVKSWEYWVNHNLNIKPDEDSEGYAYWKIGYDYVDSLYRQWNHKKNIILTDIEQSNTLYNMDLEYKQKQLNRLRQNRKEEAVVSQMDGYLVAINTYDAGNYIQADETIVAVGDTNIKELKVEYISKSDFNRAKEVYAFVNGKRYEVEYHPIETEEYLRLTSQDEKIQTTFTLLDAEDVEIGAFGVICMINDAELDVLSVPKDALQREEETWYLYKVDENGQQNRVDVKPGVSDGVYTQILSGLDEGDKILYSTDRKPGSKTQKVERGTIATKYSERGAMYYPSSSYLKNPVENGTVYMQEMKVVQYQKVDKGDVICTVRVVADELALTRNLNSKKHLQTRIDDFVAQKDDLDEEYYAEQLKNLNKQMADLDEVIAKQRSDFATKEIKADKAGVITWVSNVEKENIINPNANIVQIADQTNCFIRIEDNKGILQYGNTVTVTYDGSDGQKHSVEGTVANVPGDATTRSIRSNYVYISLPEEEMGYILTNTARRNEWEDYWNPNRYTVSGSVKAMNNAMLVPRAAVWERSGRTYVYVKLADGTIESRSIITGGSDLNSYWVIEGLTEGMEICLD